MNSRMMGSAYAVRPTWSMYASPSRRRRISRPLRYCSVSGMVFLLDAVDGVMARVNGRRRSLRVALAPGAGIIGAAVGDAQPPGPVGRPCRDALTWGPMGGAER